MFISDPMRKMYKISKNNFAEFIGNLQNETLPYSEKNRCQMGKYLLMTGKGQEFDIYYTGKIGHPTVSVRYDIEKCDDGDYVLKPSIRLTRVVKYVLLGWMGLCLVAACLTLGWNPALLVVIPIILLATGFMSFVYRVVGKVHSYSKIDTLIKNQVEKVSHSDP